MRTLNKEEMLVVYLALMICRQLGFPKPPKRQVLNVVESWELLKFSPDDHDIVSTGERIAFECNLPLVHLVDSAG